MIDVFIMEMLFDCGNKVFNVDLDENSENHVEIMDALRKRKIQKDALKNDTEIIDSILAGNSDILVDLFMHRWNDNDDSRIIDKKLHVIHKRVCASIYLNSDILARAVLTLRKWMYQDRFRDELAINEWNKVLIDSVSDDYKSLQTRVIEMTETCCQNNDSGKRIRRTSPLIYGMTAQERISFMRGWKLETI